MQGHFLNIEEEALQYSYPHAIYASEIIQPYTNGAAKWWLSLFTRQYVQGVLTGEGADEVFCGYPSYKYLAWWQFYRRTNSDCRKDLYIKRISAEKPWERGISSQQDGRDLEESLQILHWAHPLFAQIFALAELYFSSKEKALAWLQRTRESLASYQKNTKAKSPLLQWQNYFLHTHFPTHVLNWVGDRMEMANTLEGRPIYLSKDILSFAQELPDVALVRGMRDKAILRKAYARELKSFAATPKKQFNAPFLFNEKLQKEFLEEDCLKTTGIFDYKRITQLQAAIQNEKNLLQRSYKQIFLQNILVLHMLQHFLIEGRQPQRDFSWEKRYIERNKKINP